MKYDMDIRGITADVIRPVPSTNEIYGASLSGSIYRKDNEGNWVEICNGKHSDSLCTIQVTPLNSDYTCVQNATMKASEIVYKTFLSEWDSASVHTLDADLGANLLNIVRRNVTDNDSVDDKTYNDAVSNVQSSNHLVETYNMKIRRICNDLFHIGRAVTQYSEKLSKYATDVRSILDFVAESRLFDNTTHVTITHNKFKDVLKQFEGQLHTLDNEVTLTDEEFVAIPGISDYTINRYGQVKNCGGKIVEPIISDDNLLIVIPIIRNNSYCIQYPLSLLMFKTFHKDKYYDDLSYRNIYHLNGDCKDFTASNLITEYDMEMRYNDAVKISYEDARALCQNILLNLITQKYRLTYSLNYYNHLLNTQYVPQFIDDCRHYVMLNSAVHRD